MTEDEMFGWHHRLNGHGFEWTSGVGNRQGGLACCSSWGHKESDTTERLNLTELKYKMLVSFILDISPCMKICVHNLHKWSFMVFQMAKNPPAMQETQQTISYI